MFEIQYLIYIYIALCICMMIFNIVYILYYESTEKLSKNEKYGITKRINKQFKLLRDNEKVTTDHMKYLTIMLRWTSN